MTADSQAPPTAGTGDREKFKERRYLARWIVSSDRPIRRDGWVRIRGGQIIATGIRDGVGFARESIDIDLGDVALLPGLTNAHTHLEFSDLAVPIGYRGIPLDEWIGAVVAAQSDRDELARHAAIRSGLHESDAAGVVLVGDIDTPPPAESGNATTAPSAETAAQLSRLPAPRVAGEMPFDGRCQRRCFAEVIGLSKPRGEERWQAALSSIGAGGDLAGISPHAPYSTPWSRIEACVDLSRRRRIPLAMHVAESPAERDLLSSGRGTFVTALQRIGAWQPGQFPWPHARPFESLIALLGRAPHGLLIHGNVLNDDEIQACAAQRRLTVVYCPRTHHFFEHPRHPVKKLIEAGVPVALGTDSRASNPDLNLWREVRFLLARRCDLDPPTVIAMATIHGATALMRRHVGRLTSGYSANLNMIPSRASTLDQLYRDCAENDAVPLSEPIATGP